MNKKLYRSKTDQKIAGVCAGLAEYLNIDPTIIRLIWALVALSGAGVLAYIVCALVIPEKPAEIGDDHIIDAE
ncbi:MAG: PspC domain-containing protein [Oscillospiraceae bacterium]|nr:PspC domain-containing protein [Oscillospiraceae bacterium]